MRILHVYKRYLPDDFTGIPRVLDAIAKEAISQGHEFHVLTLSKQPASKQPIEINGQTIWQSYQQLYIDSTGISIPALFRFRRLVRLMDIVHYHHPWPLQDVMHLLPGRVPPSVVTYHADVESNKLYPIYKWLLLWFMSQVGHVVATSPTYAETSSVLSRLKHKLSVIPIGISAERPTLDPELLAHWRARLGAGFMLFVGAHRGYKGLHDLYEAARLSSLPIVVAGEPSKGAPPPEDLPSNVTLLGHIEDADKEALLELCTALVLPSHRRAEAFGIVLLEAMRAKRAIITCEIGSGMSYVNQHEKTGLIIPPQSPPALAEAMTRLAEDPAWALKLGQAGQARFEAIFQQETMGRAYMELYERIIMDDLNENSVF